MVYQIFSDGIDRRNSIQTADHASIPGLAHKQQANARPRGEASYAAHLANLLIVLIKMLLLTYDFLTLPIYFVLQRPDKRARLAKRARSRQVDARTWVHMVDHHQQQETNQYTVNDWESRRVEAKRRKWCYAGSTVSEIFTNAVGRYNGSPCLGYRALVTCPVIQLDEASGQQVFRDQSFRSDFTWYTYGQVGRRVQDLASGLHWHAGRARRALFLASSSLEWFCLAQACFQLALQLVTWPERNNEPRALLAILREAQIEALFVSCDQLELLCRFLRFLLERELQSDLLQLKTIVIIDWQFAVDLEEPLFSELGRCLKRFTKWASTLKVLSLGQLEEAGIEHQIELSCSRALSDEQLVESLVCREVESTNNSRKVRDQRRWFVGVDPIEATSFASRSAPLIRRQISQQGQSSGDLINLASLSDTYQNNGTDRRKINASIATRGQQVREPQEDDLALIVYTHGALGQLQSVRLSQGQLARSNHQLFLDGMLGADDIHCAVLPLDCPMELMVELRLFGQGGTIGYSNNLRTLFRNGSELFDRDLGDLEALQPSHLLVQPHVLEQLRQSLQEHLQLEMNPVVSFLFKNVVFEYKKFWSRHHFATPLVDWLFCARLRRFFGSRMEHIICTSTTDCLDTRHFFANMLGLPLVEVYGPDEAIASMISLPVDRLDGRKRDLGATNAFSLPAHEYDLADMQLMPPSYHTNVYRENFSKNILATSTSFRPTNGMRVRLEDWEEFRLSDAPYPRGRLLLGGEPTSIASGYASHKEQLGTNSSDPSRCDSMGVYWLRTDDIVRAFPNGSFEIISDISNIIKMADGQFVSLSQIEYILRNNQFVDNVCVVCHDEGNLVISLVVPNLRRIARKSPNEANLKGAIGAEPEPAELADVDFRREVCNDRLLCEFVTDHLSKLLARSGLASITNRFLLVPEIWTPESGLVTATYEPKRQAVQKFYANDIQSLIRMQARKGSRRVSDNRSRNKTSI